MIVLKIIGWVLLGILALIILALCVRVVVSAEYSENKTEVLLKWLFIKIPLYPAQKKTKKAPEKSETDRTEPTSEEGKTENEAAPTAESGSDNADAPADDGGETTDADKSTEEKKNNNPKLLKLIYDAEGVDGLIEIVKRVFSYLGTFFGGLLRAFIIEELDLDVSCAKKDAAKTAVYYGEVCSTLFPMLGGLASGCTLKKYDVNVYPDFLARYSEASFYIRFHVVPIRLIGITLALVFKLLFKVLAGLLIKLSRTKKNVLSAERDKDQSNTKENNNIRKSEVTNE